MCVLAAHEAAAEPVERDPHSYSQPHEARVTHAEIDWTADFERHEIVGTVAWDFVREVSGAPLVLDTRGLAIESILSASGEPLRYDLGADDPRFGRPLVIHAAPAETRVVIRYRTNADAEALQWLDPVQTAGKTQPFLFSQAQSILARTMLPCQDTPSVRVTYNAAVTVPAGLVAVMAAKPLTPTDAALSGAATTYRFEMPQPIPSYLIALAVGDIEHRSLGARTGVYAEPPVVERAAYEFADAESMLEAAERLFGPYRWERYDIIVLPPSFPFGGMENPRLTFATPTVLAGDRSLVSVVAHELAHSWSGNLVTNASWADFWLNEGFTNYFERRIIEEVYGRERAEMEKVLGWNDLMEELPTIEREDQRLHRIALADPNASATIAYEKGAMFLLLLEETVGRPRFDRFLRDWFDENAFTSRTTADFERALRTKLFGGDETLERTTRMHEWLYEPGIPPNLPNVRSALLTDVSNATRAFTLGNTSARELPAKTWSTQEWIHFLQELPHDLPVAKMEELDQAWGLTQRGNSQVLMNWLLLSIRTGYTATETVLETFLTTQGRRWYLDTLYRELAKTPEGKTRAEAIYEIGRPLYHPIARVTIDDILRGTEP
jgi:aminopeptidase N